MTFFDEIRRANAHKNLVLAVTIDGIRFAFTERTISATALAAIGRPQQLVCVNKVTEGETKLDLDKRREIAATLDIELVDFSNFDLQEIFASASIRNTYIESNAETTDLEVSVGNNLDIIDRVNEDGYCDIFVGSETITVVGIGTVSSTISNEPVMFGDILGWGAIPLMPIAVGDALQIVRGAYDSVPIELRGNTVDADGDSVFLVAPAWKGRRAKLWGIIGDEVYCLNSFIVDGSPEVSGERSWRIRFAGIAQRYYEKNVYFGVGEAVIQYDGFRDIGGGVIVTDFLVTSNINALNDTGTQSVIPNLVILSGIGARGEDVKAIYRVQNVDDFGILTVYQQPLYGTPITSQTIFSKAQPLLMRTGASHSNIVSVITSREGQSAASPPFNYDILTGRKPLGFDDAGWRLGAGIPITDLDIDAWKDPSINYSNQLFTASNETKLEEILLEFCLVNNCAIICDNIGRLKPLNLNVYRNSERRTLTKNDVDPDTVTYVMNDEENISPRGKVSIDYSPLEDDFKVELNLIDADLAKRYPENQGRKEFKIKSLGISNGGFVARNREFPFSHPVQVSIGEATSRFAKLLKSGFGDTLRTLSIDTTLEQLDLRVGDLVVLTDLPQYLAELPDFKGSTIEGITCRIIGKRPDYDNNLIKFTLHLLIRSLYVAPSAEIASIGGNTVTLYTTGTQLRNASPAHEFAVGCGVTVKSHNSDFALATTVTAIPASNQLTLASVAGLNVGNMVCLNPFTGDFTTTVSGYSISEIAGWTDDDGTATVTNGSNNKPVWG